MAMLNSPFLSIITVNLNNYSGLEKTINSVITQGSDAIEFIIIDGNSTDGSAELIRKNEENINYWISENDNGIYHAMNKGITAATGKYCLFLNTGDVLYDKNTINKLQQENLTGDIINFNSYVVGLSQPKTMVRSKKTISFYDFYKHTIIHQATLIKKDLFTSVGSYNESLKIVADWEFFAKAIFLKNCLYQSSDLTLSVFDSDGISSKPEYRTICLKERNEVLELYFSGFLKDYNLLKESSIYNYLGFVNAFGSLKSYFVFKTRILNKILGRFIKIE